MLLMSRSPRYWAGYLLGLSILALAFVALAASLRHAAATPTSSFWGIDFGDYWLAGGRVAHGGVPYAQAMLAGPFPAIGLDRFRYPPLFALILVPLSWLPKDSATWAWMVISSAALLAGCLLAARAGGLKLTPLSVVWIAAFLCLAPPVHDLLLVGNVGSVEALLLGLALASAPLVSATAVGLVGLLKVIPVLTWPATILRDRRAALKGFAILAGVFLATLPALGQAWLDYPTVLINELRGGPADNLGNYSLFEVIHNLLPAIAGAALVAQFAGFGLAACLVGLSLRWATRAGGWAAALLAATAAGLLLPGTFWLHYLVLLAPFILYAWPRLITWQRILIGLAAIAVHFGPPWFILAEDGLIFCVVAILLWQLRPGLLAAEVVTATGANPVYTL